MTDGVAADQETLVPALIVEDDTATQVRLRRLLGEVTGGAARIDVAGSAETARAQLAGGGYRLVLVDIALPGENGIALCDWLHRNHPEVQAVVVSSWADENTILGAIQAGAVGYLLKSADDLELVLSLRSLQRGGAPIDPGIARRILEMVSSGEPAPVVAPTEGQADEQVLTSRETDILQLVAHGLGNREIAERLGLSKLTIESHTRNIYRKLAVHSRTAAVYRAQSRGLLD